MRSCAALVILLMVTAGCVLAATKKKPQLVCVWPEPLVFGTNDDGWTICFTEDHTTFTSYKPVCTTVGALRRQLIRSRATN